MEAPCFGRTNPSSGAFGIQLFIGDLLRAAMMRLNM